MQNKIYDMLQKLNGAVTFNRNATRTPPFTQCSVVIRGCKFRASSRAHDRGVAEVNALVALAKKLVDMEVVIDG